jgi:hypothetical protein
MCQKPRHPPPHCSEVCVHALPLVGLLGPVAALLPGSWVRGVVSVRRVFLCYTMCLQTRVEAVRRYGGDRMGAYVYTVLELLI